MKPLLGIVVGFVLSFGMFVGGLAVATYLLTSDPEGQPGPSRDVADLWTEEPRRVDTAALKKLERVPAEPPPPAEPRMPGAAANPTPEPPVDAVATGSVEPAAVGAPQQPADTMQAEQPMQPADTTQADQPMQPPQAGQPTSAHAEWCAARYRSYRPESDSYTSYSGEQRPCVSPHSNGTQASAEEAAPFVDAVPETDPDATQGLGPAPQAGDPSAPPDQYASGEADSWVVSDHVSYCFNRYRSYRPEDNTYQPYDGGPRRQCR